jgi:CRP/FNR family cyclic AMP-dependent transcriptional regulator
MTNQKLIDYLAPYGRQQQLAPDATLHLGSGRELAAPPATPQEVALLPDQPLLYLLQSGKLIVSHHRRQGGVYLKYLVPPSHFFGELILSGIPTTHFFATALTPVTYTVLDMQQVRKLMAQQEDLSLELLARVARRVRQLKHKVDQLAFQDSRSRVVDFLWEMAIDFGQKEESSWVVENFLKNREIAQITFTSRQTVNSVMNELKKKGLIDFNPKQIKIRPELIAD